MLNIKYKDIKYNEIESIIKLFGVCQDILVVNGFANCPANDVKEFIIKRPNSYSLMKRFNIYLDNNAYNNVVDVISVRHNVKYPAHVTFSQVGVLWSISYFSMDYLHNPFGPAAIFFDNNTEVYREDYYIKGKLHNRVGPAIIEKQKYKYRGIRVRYSHDYFLNGVLLSKKEFYERIKNENKVR